MIDIHNHIINNVDDGCKSINDSILLLKNAQFDGITDVICTPHYMKHGKYRANKSIVEENFNILKLACINENINVNLHLGNEIMLTDEIYKLIKSIKVNTLANSKYVLFEFRFDEYPEIIYNEVYDLWINGYVPILAHPERCDAIQKNPNLVYKLINEGCLMQVNATSIMGGFGKKAKNCSKLLLENNMVHFVSSDAHSLNRSIKLSECYKYIRKNYNRDLANQLFIENPSKIIDNLDITKSNPIKIVENKNLFARLFNK